MSVPKYKRAERQLYVPPALRTFSSAANSVNENRQPPNEIALLDNEMMFIINQLIKKLNDLNICAVAKRNPTQPKEITIKVSQKRKPNEETKVPLTPFTRINRHNGYQSNITFVKNRPPTSVQTARRLIASHLGTNFRARQQ